MFYITLYYVVKNAIIEMHTPTRISGVASIVGIANYFVMMRLIIHQFSFLLSPKYPPITGSAHLQRWHNTPFHLI